MLSCSVASYCCYKCCSGRSGQSNKHNIPHCDRERLLKAKEQPAESETDSFGFGATGGAAPATGEASGADLNGSTARDASKKDDQNAESLPESPQPAQVPVSRIAMSSRVQLPASDKLADASAHILETAKSDAEGPGIPGASEETLQTGALGGSTPFPAGAPS